jgi:hypothetical protein
MENQIGDRHGKQIALPFSEERDTTMDALVIASALVGSFVGAFILQKVALTGLFHMMHVERRPRE